jgi:hypothetical protein
MSISHVELMMYRFVNPDYIPEPGDKLFEYKCLHLQSGTISTALIKHLSAKHFYKLLAQWNVQVSNQNSKHTWIYYTDKYYE